jgi:hypothetical protein
VSHNGGQTAKYLKWLLWSHDFSFAGGDEVFLGYLYRENVYSSVFKAA